METLPAQGDAFAACVAQELVASRHRLQLTQEDLAALTNGAVTKAMLSGYESGHRSMRLSTACVLARALGESAEALLGRAECRVLNGVPGRQLTVQVSKVLGDDSVTLAPMRRWLLGRYPSPATQQCSEHLTDGALLALATLMSMSIGDCTRALEPFRS